MMQLQPTSLPISRQRSSAINSENKSAYGPLLRPTSLLAENQSAGATSARSGGDVDYENIRDAALTLFNQYFGNEVIYFARR